MLIRLQMLTSLCILEINLALGTMLYSFNRKLDSICSYLIWDFSWEGNKFVVSLACRLGCLY